jgi:hypothetical protein
MHILLQGIRPSRYEIPLSKLADFKTSVISEI